MKGNIKLITLLLLFAACKPVELKQLSVMRRNIVVHSNELTIRAQVQRENMLILPKLECTYYWFEKGRVGNTQGAYSGKVLHGNYTAYDRDSKQPLESGKFNKGLKTGRWLVWTPKGIMKQSLIYKHGFLDGPLTQYDSLGKPLDTLSYRNGALQIRKVNDSTGWIYKIKKLFKKKK